MLTSMAVVMTDASSRYAKQLLSHLGHKVAVEPLAGRPEPAGRLVFSYGVGTVLPLTGRLVLRASADDADSLARVQDVVGRHLAKFGARRELVISWGPDAPDEDLPEPAVTTDPDDAAAAVPIDVAATATENFPEPELAPELDEPEATTADPPTGIQAVHTEKAPPHTGPVPQAVRAGDWVFVSALFGSDPDRQSIPDDVTAEAQQLFDNLVAILDAVGATLNNVVRVGIVMRDLQRDRPAFNAVWQERFGNHRPARSAIQSAEFGRPGQNPKLMIEATAYLG